MNHSVIILLVIYGSMESILLGLLYRAKRTRRKEISPKNIFIEQVNHYVGVVNTRLVAAAWLPCAYCGRSAVPGRKKIIIYHQPTCTKFNGALEGWAQDSDGNWFPDSSPLWEEC